MKRLLLSLSLTVCLSILMSSCYVHTYMVGNGPQTGVKVKRKNHYLLNGLAPIGVSNPSKMAGSAKNYEVTTKHSFVDQLIGFITFGLYTPTTTVVRK